MRKIIIQLLLCILLTVIVVNLYHKNTVLRAQRDILGEGTRAAASGS
jgi:hypothetical protein